MTAFAGISHELRGNFAGTSRKLLAHRVGASRPVPNPDPFTLRRAVLPTDLTSSSVIDSQFFVSISDLTKKLALVASSWGLRFVMVKAMC